MLPLFSFEGGEGAPPLVAAAYDYSQGAKETGGPTINMYMLYTLVNIII